MDRFIHNENLKLYRKALAETTDEDKRRILRELIRQEEEQDLAPVERRSRRNSD